MQKNLKKKRNNNINNNNAIAVGTRKFKEQETLFNVERYGRLSFFLTITYKQNNVFFLFGCKASKIKNRIFTLAKTSCGIDNRDKIRSKLYPKVQFRGRIKRSFVNIKNKYIQILKYMANFARVHPLICATKNFYVYYKIYKIDFVIINLINVNLNLKYNYHNFYKLNYLNFPQLPKPTPLNKYLTPKIYKNIIFKFPHNGCRPKKIRRIKTKRRK